MNLVDKAKHFVADKVADVKKPEASIKDVDLKDVGRQGITYLAKVSIKNPYSVSIPICEIKYSLKSVDRFFLNSFSSQIHCFYHVISLPSELIG